MPLVYSNILSFLTYESKNLALGASPYAESPNIKSPKAGRNTVKIGKEYRYFDLFEAHEFFMTHLICRHWKICIVCKRKL